MFSTYRTPYAPRGGASIAAILAAALLVAGQAAAQPLVLERLPPVAKGSDALPRITAPSNAATTRVNAALARLDARWRDWLRGCNPGGDGAVTRTVTIAMQGPKVLSLVIADDSYCGGAHPDTSLMALAYDVETGRPLDWTRLLPPALVRSSGRDENDDGAPIGTIASAALQRLYLAAIRTKHGADADWRSGCGDALGGEDLAFQLWPDAKADAVLVAPVGLPFALAACAEPVPLMVSKLRPMGVDGALLDAIDAAHRSS